MTITDVTDTWSQPIPAPRRRPSAQKRLRAEAEKLDAKGGERRPTSNLRATVTADQLRLVADLLDHPSWGQE